MARQIRFAPASSTPVRSLASPPGGGPAGPGCTTRTTSTCRPARPTACRRIPPRQPVNVTLYPIEGCCLSPHQSKQPGTPTAPHPPRFRAAANSISRYSGRCRPLGTKTLKSSPEGSRPQYVASSPTPWPMRHVPVRKNYIAPENLVN